jgi:two-component system catabolic regulation response regulator CreB
MAHSAPCVFVVDDETAIAEAVSFALRADGFECRHFTTGNECLAALAAAPPALVLLDIGLPDGSGFEFFRRIRERGETPVIFLTARREEIDRVAGLEMGADDYIVKPFSVREVMARVRLVIRRQSGSQPGPGFGAGEAREEMLSVGPFVRDRARRQIRYSGKLLDLTLHEYRLLEALLDRPGQVFSRAQLLERAWEAPDHRLERTVDSHIKSLRAKIRAADSATDPIRTHRGVGYSLDVQE